MRDQTSWSVSLGRWHGVTVRVHLFFLLFAAFTMLLASSRAANGPASQWPWIAAASLGILLISLLVHEFAHLITATHFGGGGDEIVLGPFGGLSAPNPPPDPRHEVGVHLAGPLANALLFLVAATVVLFAGQSSLFGLLHPLAPRNLLDPPDAGWMATGAKLACWINWVLLLANLIPAFPFDGGRAMRAGILALRPDWPAPRAMFLVTSLAKVSAFGLLVAAVMMWSNKANDVLPTWFSLLILALVLYFSARRYEVAWDEPASEERPFGYDFSQGYTSLERSGPAPEQPAVEKSRGWLEERRQTRQQRQRDVELDEERRVDEILKRVHERGIDSLSEDDRLLLKRVSQRIRHRQEPK